MSGELSQAIVVARHLATIQKVTTVNAIPEADSIEVLSILGWKVVCKKGEFKVGALVCYFEIDTLLPVRPEFEFLRERCFKKNGDISGFRLKTIRLRGQLSQGLCWSTSILPEGTKIEEGADVTEILGVEKYLPAIPENMKGIVKGEFPAFGLKSDETRVQVLQDVITRHKGTICAVTEKVDGSSATYFLNKGDFGVCSRNLELKETLDNLFWKVARKQKIEEKLRALGKNMMIQGELCGLGVQKNNLRLPDTTVLFFNAFDIDKFRYYDHADFVNIIGELGLQTVPILETEYILDDNIDTLVEKSKGTSVLNPKVFREGIVIRPLIEKMDFKMAAGFGNGRVSFKAINPDYLLKFEE